MDRAALWADLGGLEKIKRDLLETVDAPHAGQRDADNLARISHTVESHHLDPTWVQSSPGFHDLMTQMLDFQRDLGSGLRKCGDHIKELGEAVGCVKRTVENVDIYWNGPAPQHPAVEKAPVARPATDKPAG